MPILDLLYGVIVSPARTLRQIAEAKPIGWAVAILAASLVLQASLQGRHLPASPGGVLLPVSFHLASLGMQILVIAVLHFVARALGGRGDFSGLLAATGFAHFPAFLQPPLRLLSQATIDTPLFRLVWVLGVALAIWLFALRVLALREAHQISTGAAIGMYVVVGLVTTAGMAIFMPF